MLLRETGSSNVTSCDGNDGRTCSGLRIARHSSSDLVLLALDIFRMVTVDLKGVGAKKMVGRDIYSNDERAARLRLSDGGVNVMCQDASAHSRNDRILHVIERIPSCVVRLRTVLTIHYSSFTRHSRELA